MPIYSNLPLLLAQVNVERAKQKQPQISLRRLAEETGISLSVLISLNTGKSQRIDYSTIDRLLIFFNRYLPVDAGDLLVWEPESEGAE